MFNEIIDEEQCLKESVVVIVLIISEKTLKATSIFLHNGHFMFHSLSLSVGS